VGIHSFAFASVSVSVFEHELRLMAEVIIRPATKKVIINFFIVVCFYCSFHAAKIRIIFMPATFFLIFFFINNHISFQAG